MKEYKDKSSAIRAAAAALGVPRSVGEVEKVAILHRGVGGWGWRPLPETEQEASPAGGETTHTHSPSVRNPSPEMPPPKEVPPSPKTTFTAPKQGTLCSRIWLLAEQSADRKAFMATCAQTGINKGTAAQQYHRWRNRKDKTWSA